MSTLVNIGALIYQEIRIQKKYHSYAKTNTFLATPLIKKIVFVFLLLLRIKNIKITGVNLLEYKLFID